ncbi:MAG: hypothetical protein GSR80_000413 [Desulfurococcales archaeon]|nr:hypothetical protein [Desulfurococcales archaeon]
MEWWSKPQAHRYWGGSEEELRSAVERHGCEGALILCYQSESESDCYRRLEEECALLAREKRGGDGAASDEGGDTADCEPGPAMY